MNVQYKENDDKLKSLKPIGCFWKFCLQFPNVGFKVYDVSCVARKV